MDFNNVMAIWQARIGESTEQPNPAASDNPIDTMPGNMPLTKRLDKMTRDQAIWAIENGDAWIAYLKEQSGRTGHQTYQLLSMTSNRYNAAR